MGIIISVAVIFAIAVVAILVPCWLSEENRQHTEDSNRYTNALCE